MNAAPVKLVHLAVLAACLALAGSLGRDWERRLALLPYGGDLTREQASSDEEDGEDAEETQEYTSRESRNETGTSQRVYRAGAELKADYHFINFNKDRLNVSFGMTRKDYGNYLGGYGYTDTDLAKLRIWRDATRQEAWEKTYKESGKAAAESAVAGVDMDYDTRLRALLRSKGLAMRPGNVVEPDMPVMIKRNTPLLKPLALAFQKVANSRGYSDEDIIGAVLSMVQTAIRYKIPNNLENGLHTCGILPPARALLSGWGDCDTKTGVLASVLGNWSRMRMVGIAVPGHYLMAIRRLPGKGDMFVRYEGLEYVLVEPAGPAWLEPGMVGDHTKTLLAGAQGYKVEPFF